MCSKELIVTLREDRWYNYRRFKKELRNKIYLPESCVEQLFDKVKSFTGSKLRKALKDAKELRELFDIESPLPRVEDDWFNVGQWVGLFNVEDPPCGFDRLIVEVEPKIGWDRFNYMLSECFGLPAIVGPGVLSSLVANIVAPYGYALDVIYSDLAYKYTEMALREPLPRLTEDFIVVGGSEVGRIDVSKTVKLRMRGLSLVASRRSRLVQAQPPMMLIARFHYRLFTRLKELLEKIGSVKSLGSVRSELEKLIARHSYILTLTPIAPYIDLAFTGSIDDVTLVKETRAKSGVNVWLRMLADLYGAYNARVAGVEVSRTELPLQLLPSSKVFELWALRLVVEALAPGKRVVSVKLERNRSGFTVEFEGGLKIYYNVPYKKGRLTEELRRMGLLSKEAFLRPDYVIEHNGKIIVADAKYKEKLTTGDLGRIVTYMVDIATPMKTNGEELIGTLILLIEEGDQQDKRKQQPRISRAKMDGELTTRYELRIAHVNPGTSFKGRNVNSIRNVLQ